ncbi:MAG: hypothetical protein H7Z12_14040 [Rhodospirillaceae bacterium]|nr:hypothetical protein [Rhodospirillales bacterium]
MSYDRAQLRFVPQALDPSDEKIEDRFVAFAAQLLGREPGYAQLRYNRPGGADGGTDISYALSATDMGAIDCKCIGNDKVGSVTAAWNTVADVLRTNLTADQPKQLQYRIWYDKHRPIRAYTLCVSNHLQRDDHRKQVREAIEALFLELSQRNGLDHLKAIKVDVLEWGGLVLMLDRHPGLALNWFPQLRPYNLEPLAVAARRKASLFARYLEAGSLPYFSSEDYARSVGAAGRGAAADPAFLVSQLDACDAGLIITGSGGIGKTRLMLELGLQAEKSGWTVLKAVGSLSRDHWERAIRHMATGENQRLLILVDYAEEQENFKELARFVLADHPLTVRVAANCRSSAYPRFRDVYGLQRINISREDASEAEWWRNYRRWVVGEILRHTSVIADPRAPEARRYLDQCADLPVLAAFMAYLLKTKGREELTALVAEPSFVAWLSHRINKHFCDQDRIGLHFAQLMALLPSSLDGIRRDPRFRELLAWLKADGWVTEQPSADGHIVHESLHDVVVDQLLAFHVEAQGTLYVADFAAELLDLAEGIPDAPPAALRSLGRVADRPPFNQVSWMRVLQTRVQERPDVWAQARAALLAGGLLKPAEAIALFRATPDLLEGKAETENAFQRALGDVARSAAKGEAELDPANHDWLLEWMERCIAHVGDDDYLLTSGLRLAPHRFAPAARAWLTRYPETFFAHFLLVAWLEAKLPLADVALLCHAWARKFCRSRNFSYILRALATAKDDLPVLAEPIRDWLSLSGMTPAATFVFRSWLDATKDRALVETAIAEWLAVAENRLSADASYVFQSWLDATKDRTLVETAIVEWLAVVENRLLPDASYVFKSWLDATEDRTLVETAIAEWLAVTENRLSADAQFVFNSWLSATEDRTLVETAIAEWLAVVENRLSASAQFVFKSWLDATKNRTLVETTIAEWLAVAKNRLSPVAQFVFTSWLDATKDRTLVESTVAEWLTVPENRLSPEASHGFKAWLDATKDCTMVQAAIADWVAVADNRQWAEADFVYRAWLDAKGEFSFIAAAALEWLHLYRDTLMPRYLLKHICANANRLPPAALEDALHWCRSFPEDDDTPSRLNRMMKALERNGRLPEAVAAASACWNRHRAKPRPSRDSVDGWVFLVGALVAINEMSGYKAQIDSILAEWLQDSRFCAPSTPRPRGMKLWIIDRFPIRALALVRDGAITVPGTIARFLKWWEGFDPTTNQDTIGAVRELSRLSK